MKAPRFWWQQTPSLMARALAPFAHLYGFFAAKPFAKSAAQFDVPIVVVGNFVAGGAGKTPICVWLVQGLVALGHRPVVVSRGYGGGLQGPVLVDGQSATDVGDEPLLLAEFAPVVVAKNRVQGVQKAIELGADVVVLDDGFQSRLVEFNFALMVVDGEVGFGNGLCLPAGPLRAPLAVQLAHTHALVMMGEGMAQQSLLPALQNAHIATFEAKLAPTKPSTFVLEGKKLFAFAGIGRPEKFLQTLKTHKLDVLDFVGFDDHYEYTRQDLERLKRQADILGAQLVTTQKDFVRLGALAQEFGVLSLPVFVDMPASEALLAMIGRAIAPK